MPADDGGRLGGPTPLRRLLGGLVPQWLARRAVAVSVDTDRDRFAVGERVTLRITLRNRLPVPVTVRTPRQRRWGWTVDGELAASDERPFVRDRPATLSFRPNERRTVTREWDGRFTRTSDDGLDERVPAAPGDHELAAFVAVDGEPRPADATTVVVEGQS